jgi:hypothetical protein
MRCDAMRDRMAWYDTSQEDILVSTRSIVDDVSTAKDRQVGRQTREDRAEWVGFSLAWKAAKGPLDEVSAVILHSRCPLCWISTTFDYCISSP